MVEAATNGEAAVGGADIEAEPEMMDRASRTLRHGGRAVTAQDFADLALESSRAVARAVALTPSFSPISQADGPKTGPQDLHRDGEVIVVIVPAIALPGEAPTVDLLAGVEDYLRARCAPGAHVKVMGPSWVACDIVVHVQATSLEGSDATLMRVDAAVARFLDPLVGGDGHGWDFGRRPRTSDLVARITAVSGVDHISDLEIRCAAPFDVDDLGLESSIDELSLLNRLLVYARSIRVSTPQKVTP
jgi:hypothetical protein